MVSRLMLNLRIGNDIEKRLSGTSGPVFRSTVIRDITPNVNSPRTFEDTIIGNLGAGVSFWDNDDEHEETQDSDDTVIELTPRHPYNGGSTSHHPFAAGAAAAPYYRDW